MTGHSSRFLLSIAILTIGTLASAADPPRGKAAENAERQRAAEKCEAYLHSALEAMAEKRLPEAERWLKQARTEAEKIGAESLAMAGTLSSLGALALMREQNAEAEAFLTRALALEEKALGPDDSVVGQALHNLGMTKVALKKYDESEPIARRALAIRERTIGADDTDVASTLDLLAVIYVFQDKIPGAEEMFRRELEIREKTQGPEHPDVVKALTNMAELRISRARSGQMDALLRGINNLNAGVPNDTSLPGFRAAESLLERALNIREKSLGPEHPDTIETLQLLSVCYNAHDDDDHAVPLFRRLVTVREKTLGPDAPEVAGPLIPLANRAMAHGKYRDAEADLRRALAILEKVHRAHPGDRDVKDAEEWYARELRKAVRSAEVMEDPKRRPTADDLKFVYGEESKTHDLDVIHLLNNEFVNLPDESISDADLIHLRGLVNAETLAIKAGRITDEGLVHLEGLTTLTSLLLIGGSKIRGPGLVRLKGMTKLEDLNLRASSRFDDDGLAHLPSFPRLKTLDLSHTSISDAGLVHLQRLPALEELNLLGTKVTDAGIKTLQRSRPTMRISYTKHSRPGARIP